MVGMVALAALLFLACGQIQPPPVLEHAPASALIMAIQLEDGPRPYGSQYVINTKTIVTVNFSSDGHAVALSNQQKLWCNGVPFPYSNTGELTALVDPPPAGGSYSFTYTDEQGHRTTFSVSAIAPVTFISPAPGARVAIPRPVSSVPTPAPQTIPPGSRTPNLDHVPLIIRYALPTLPPAAAATMTMWAQCSASDQLTGCGDLIGPRNDPATGRYTISDAPFAYGYGFETFVPGNGHIQATLRVIWYPATAFGSVKITYTKDTEAPITWTAN